MLSAPAVAECTCCCWLQMVSLTLLIVARDGGEGALVEFAGTAGPVLLSVATWLTVHSLVAYLRALWPYMSS